MTASRDLLRSQLDRDQRHGDSLSARIARWLLTDARAQRCLRLELERCRFHHRHEMNRLQTLLEGRLPIRGADRDDGRQAP